MVTISKVTMIIASKCGRFWALHILVQCAFRYFSCGKRNEIFRLRKVVLKLTALVPSTLQRCRSNRDFGAVVRAEISSVLSRMKSQQSLEISAGSGCSAARKKRLRLPCVWGILVFFSVLGYLRARRFFCEMRSHGHKARFNANQQQKIARAHPSGAFKDGKVWFAKNVKNSNWKRQSRGQGTADERDWGRCAKYPPENTRKDF